VKWWIAVVLFLSGCSAHRPYDQPRRYSVFVDAGHGGRDGGSCVPGLCEKDVALDTAVHVERDLRMMGYNVYMSRTDDRFVPLLTRVAASKRHGADVYVSIHCNSAKNCRARGFEVYYYARSKYTAASKQLAVSIVGRLSRLALPSRGVKSGNFCVIREPTVPSVLVETAFLSNVQDARLLRSAAFRRYMAKAIAQGIDNYFSGR